MTKKWSATKSLDGQTKRAASKEVRRAMKKDMENFMNALADVGLEHPDLIDEAEQKHPR